MPVSEQGDPIDAVRVAEGVSTARTDVAAFEYHRDLLKVSGADAVTYLQGQVSADVTALAVGDSAWSLVLEPQGKVDAWFRLTRTGDQELLVDVDGGWGERTAARLRRFLLRVDVTIEEVERRCLALRGPRAPAAAAARPRAGAMGTGRSKRSKSMARRSSSSSSSVAPSGSSLRTSRSRGCSRGRP